MHGSMNIKCNKRINDVQVKELLWTEETEN